MAAILILLWNEIMDTVVCLCEGLCRVHGITLRPKFVTESNLRHSRYTAMEWLEADAHAHTAAWAPPQNLATWYSDRKAVIGPLLHGGVL